MRHGGSHLRLGERAAEVDTLVVGAAAFSPALRELGEDLHRRRADCLRARGSLVRSAGDGDMSPKEEVARSAGRFRVRPFSRSVSDLRAGGLLWRSFLFHRAFPAGVRGETFAPGSAVMMGEPGVTDYTDFTGFTVGSSREDRSESCMDARQAKRSRQMLRRRILSGGRGGLFR